ncbi:hypothetical protein PV327_004810 [Microctonus hyperodae]|uniref:Uncharacterized protein n=1 Tax=Microctonus hyperodae TaxID=165561 RepID=A0AA39KN03_MICHY|nr:hypothetical protein PV327_004810 [Microctonus hyperodae]
MASYMLAACSLAVKQSGNLILDLNISTVIPHHSSNFIFFIVSLNPVWIPHTIFARMYSETKGTVKLYLAYLISE